MEVVADISFEQAVFGDRIPVPLRLPSPCNDCSGTGAGQGTQPVTCSECSGSGQVRRVRQSVLGQMVTSAACGRCGGMGEVIATPCATCRGEGRVTTDETYDVDVPAGVDTGATLRLTGRGAAGPRGGARGDLYVHLRVAAHERYQRDGTDLVTRVPVSVSQAALGTTIELPTLDGDEELQVQRLLVRDAETIDQAQRMLAAQSSRSERLSIADDVIDNSGDLRSTRTAVTQLDRMYRRLARRQGRP